MNEMQSYLDQFQHGGFSDHCQGIIDSLENETS